MRRFGHAMGMPIASLTFGTSSIGNGNGESGSTGESILTFMQRDGRGRQWRLISMVEEEGINMVPVATSLLRSGQNNWHLSHFPCHKNCKYTCEIKMQLKVLLLKINYL